jgi:dolichol-phosphate mannosyltransferase
MTKKLISIISPCFNEELNIEELYRRVAKSIAPCVEYEFEYLFIDNASTDGTVEKLKKLIKEDPRIKVIVNTRNFGHIRSPYWGLIQTSGDATIYLASDLQDPPEMIPEFLQDWENGWKVVLAVKPTSKSNGFMHFIRRTYYRFLNRISDIHITRDSTGFGLYDCSVIKQLRSIHDPYPFLRGLINELGYKIKEIPFDQPRRIKGISKNNFYTLYDIAMLGVISHSRVPIRLATFFGFILSIFSILTAFFFLIYKLIFWNEFALGIAPIVIGMFFMFGVLMGFIGLLGEYIGAIHTYVQKRPIVVEEERINFK